jgi:hypothetical protein
MGCFDQSQKGRAAQQGYNKSTKGRAAGRRYDRSPKGLARGLSRREARGIAAIGLRPRVRATSGLVDAKPLATEPRPLAARWRNLTTSGSP